MEGEMSEVAGCLAWRTSKVVLDKKDMYHARIACFLEL